MHEYLKPIQEMIQEKFTYHCSRPSDINEHLPILKEYAEKCDHITEMGVRDVVSTWAFLAGNPKVIRSYDVYQSPNIEEAIQEGMNKNVDIVFTKADVLEIEIEPTDLLFIDTLHTYSQLKKELAIHAHKVRKYIIFHDVVTYGHKPEPSEFNTHKGVVKQIPEVLKNYVKNDKGIMPAIEEFLKSEKDWSVEKLLTNNNGLMIIKRG